MTRLYNGVVRVDAPCPLNVLRVDLGAMPMVEEMNRTGILIDKAKFAALDLELAGKELAAQDAIETMVGWRCNPNSGDQVARLVFGELGLESPLGLKMTRLRRRPAVDDDILASLLAAHPVVPLIRAGRELSKLRGTYTQKLPLMAWPDGRIRTTIRMNVARTGRMASEEPNLQQTPIMTEEGRRIRSCFVAPPGRVLGAIDLSQIEMVWAAELSGDTVMAEVFRLKQDLHVRTACPLFKLDYARILALWTHYKADELEGAALAEMRDFEMTKRLAAKHLGFGVLFGITPEGLQAGILAAGGPLFTPAECASYILGWFDFFAGVRDWTRVQYSRAQRWGMVWTAFGRWRLVGEAMSAVPRVRSTGLRQAQATPIQGSAGDHLKLSMAEIIPLVHYYRHMFPNCTCLPILQIHDELLFELSPDIATDFLEEARSIMVNAVRPMSVPVRASISVAGDWGGLK